eukprot:1158702-Pelagomonas_calceolata.AAC.12
MLSLQGALDYVYVLRSIGDPDEIFLQGILDNACVQAAEREYCTVANVLAGKLLEEADKRSSALAVPDKRDRFQPCCLKRQRPQGLELEAGGSSAKKMRGSAKRARTLGSPQQQQRPQGLDLDGTQSGPEVLPSDLSGAGPIGAVASSSVAGGFSAVGAGPSAAGLSVGGPVGAGVPAAAVARDTPMAGALAEGGGSTVAGPSTNDGPHCPAGADADLPGTCIAAVLWHAVEWWLLCGWSKWGRA